MSLASAGLAAALIEMAEAGKPGELVLPVQGKARLDARTGVRVETASGPARVTLTIDPAQRSENFRQEMALARSELDIPSRAPEKPAEADDLEASG